MLFQPPPPSLPVTARHVIPVGTNGYETYLLDMWKKCKKEKEIYTDSLVLQRRSSELDCRIYHASNEKSADIGGLLQSKA